MHKVQNVNNLGKKISSLFLTYTYLQTKLRLVTFFHIFADKNEVD